MTNAEAAVWLYRLKNSIKGKFEADLEISVALDMAIDALKKDGDTDGREDIRKKLKNLFEMSVITSSIYVNKSVNYETKLNEEHGKMMIFIIHLPTQ